LSFVNVGLVGRLRSGGACEVGWVVCMGFLCLAGLLLWGRKKAVAAARVVGCEGFIGWLASGFADGFCNVKWERPKTVHFDKISVANPNKQ